MNNLLVFTGAGISAESGLATFRTGDGTWDKHDLNVVCNYNTCLDFGHEVRTFYNERRAQIKNAVPNDGHRMLARLQSEYGTRVKIWTQNVDDLLERAGCTDVTHVHVHGRIQDMECISCTHEWETSMDYVQHEHDTCPACGSSKIKPGVVFFYQPAPEYGPCFKAFRESRSDVILVIGTSGQVIDLAKIAGNRRSVRKSYTVLNNLDHDHDHGAIKYGLFDRCIFAPVTEACSEIMDLVYNKLD